ncbi:unnamed protein product [Closterium sp. NIES-54]
MRVLVVGGTGGSGYWHGHCTVAPRQLAGERSSPRPTAKVIGVLSQARDEPSFWVALVAVVTGTVAVLLLLCTTILFMICFFLPYFSHSGGSLAAAVQDSHCGNVVGSSIPAPHHAVPHRTSRHHAHSPPSQVVRLRPRFVIPIGGIVVGSSMTIAANTMQRLADDFQQRRGQVGFE